MNAYDAEHENETRKEAATAHKCDNRMQVNEQFRS